MSSYTTYSQEDLTKEVLIDNEDFLTDATSFLNKRRKAGLKTNIDEMSLEDKTEVYDEFMQHFRMQNVNEGTATFDLFHAQKEDAAGKTQMGNLMDTYDRMDSDFGFKAAGDYLQGIVTAPSTYAGVFSFGAAKAGAIAAQQGIKLGIREVIKRGAVKALEKQGVALTQKNIAKEAGEQAIRGIGYKEAIKSPLKTIGQQAMNYKDGFIHGGYKTAIGAGLVEGVGAGVTVYQQERLRAEQLGLKENINLFDVSLATGLATVTGGVLGGITGSSRTLSANVAEQIRMIAIAKETRGIERVNKTLAKKAFTDSTKGDLIKVNSKGEEVILKGKGESIADNAKTIYSDLKASLEESVPKLKKAGQKLKERVGISGDVDFGQVGYDLSLDRKLHENIATAAAKVLHLIPAQDVAVLSKDGLTKTLKKERIASRIARGLTSGVISDVRFIKILDEHGLSLQQFSGLLVEDYSLAGKTLQTAAQLSKAERKAKQNLLLSELTEIDQRLLNLVDIVTPATKAIKESGSESRGAKLFTLWKNWFGLGAANKARIGMMTIQTATTMRNTSSGYMRNYAYALDTFGEGLLTTIKGKVQGGSLKKAIKGLTDEEIKEAGNLNVRLGLGMMRNGWHSALGKDLWLGTRSWETEALELLLRDERFSKSDLGKKLFKELGDIGSITGQEAGIVRLARKMNYLNTLSDNMFKLAIFSREVDKWLYTSGQRGGLRGFFEDAYLDPINAASSTGKFSSLPDKVIAESMEKALEFTYQTGNFTDKEGAFNIGANAFIKTFERIIPLSFAAPFPRYLVNQLIFQWEHMPILALVNAGGILNKKGGKKGVRGIEIAPELRLKLDAESFAKQTTGLATLATFFAIRAHFGDEDTGPYTINNPFGEGQYNLQALLGPFMGFAMVADILYRMTGPNRKRKKILGVPIPQLHDNDKVAVDIPVPTREILQAIAGGQGRAGTGLHIIDATVDIVVNGAEKGVGGEFIQESIARVLGDAFNSATVGMGQLKDIAGTFLDPEYRIISDSTSVDFFEYMLKQAVRSFPNRYDANEGNILLDKEDVPVYTPYKKKPLTNVNPFLKMTTGITIEEEKTVAENELDRLRFDWFEVSPQTIKGDRPATNLARLKMGTYMDDQITGFILSDDYKNLKSDLVKRFFLKSLINQKRTASRGKIMALVGNETLEEQHQKFKNIFFSLPKSKINIVAEAYKEVSGGVSIYEEVLPGKLKGNYEYGMFLYTDYFGQEDEDLVKLKLKDMFKGKRPK